MDNSSQSTSIDDEGSAARCPFAHDEPAAVAQAPAIASTPGVLVDTAHVNARELPPLLPHHEDEHEQLSDHPSASAYANYSGPLNPHDDPERKAVVTKLYRIPRGQLCLRLKTIAWCRWRKSLTINCVRIFLANTTRAWGLVRPLATAPIVTASTSTWGITLRSLQ